MFVNTCSFKSKYWNFDLDKETEFECAEESHNNSQKCIFHDKHFLDDAKSREIIQEQFQKKIEKHLSTSNSEPLLCIGYNLYEISIEGKEFRNSVYFNHARVSGTFIAKCKFRSHVSFFNSQFIGNGNVSFLCEFSGNGKVEFNNCNYSNDGNVSFSGARFSGNGNVSFDWAQFLGGGDINFDCEFSGKGDVLFNNTNFSNVGNIYFHNAKFCNQGDVQFYETHFSNQHNIMFNEANFSNQRDVVFNTAKFSNQGDVLFNNSHFSNKGSVLFNAANFSNKGVVSFMLSEFYNHKHVSFKRAEFFNEDYVIFNNARFSNEGEILFNNARFFNLGDVQFSGVQFSKKGSIVFNNAQFSGQGNVLFISKFDNEGMVDFSNVDFSKQGKVDFTEAEFSGNGFVYFNAAKFSNPALFIKCKFLTNVFFSYVNFMNPNEVKFETDNLSNVSFINSDITRIVFGENTWFGKLGSKKVGLINLRPFERFKIFDERRFEDCINKNETTTNSNLEKEGLSLGTIQTSYRNLRENYEYRLRYDEAGQFFVREMEIRRKYREKFSFSIEKDIPKENNWFRRNFSFIGLYHNICNYGESSTRPLILFLIIMILSSAYWFVSSSIGLYLPLLVCPYKKLL
jgi:hypothetical protein